MRNFLLVLFIFISFSLLHGSIDIINIISSPKSYVNRQVNVSGTVTKLIQKNSNSSRYYYVRGNLGGVVLVYAPGRVILEEGRNYDIYGIVGYNVNYNEPFIIVSTFSSRTGNSNPVSHGVIANTNNQSTNNNYNTQSNSEPEPEIADDSITSFLKNSRISEYLLDQIGTQIIRIIHFTCSHSSTRVINRRGNDMIFETLYKGLLKRHKLVWKIVLSDSTIISDFSFLSDTNSFPSARFVNQVKDKVVEIIKSSFS